jgi:hypothetical protein
MPRTNWRFFFSFYFTVQYTYILDLLAENQPSYYSHGLTQDVKRNKQTNNMHFLCVRLTLSHRSERHDYSGAIPGAAGADSFSELAQTG